jgi:hypothetical protein
MALNPFFLHGTSSEQRLVQDLINEQLRMYGVEVLYLPRTFIKIDNILTEVTTSKFDDSFSIEAYVNNYEGYSGSGDILTKFGMSLRDEVSLIISKERFEDFIAPFLSDIDDSEIAVYHRPREGDLIYFPLGGRLFEIKFVEHEQPFYQLGKTYVYELKCELFEYEDEVGGFSQDNTSTENLENTLQKQGYITSLNLIGIGVTATADTQLVSGYIRRVVLNDDGHGYVGIPTVSFTPAPVGGTTASGRVLTRCKGGVCSIKEILLVNPGSGYTVAPTVTIFPNGSGTGAKSIAEIETTYSGIGTVSIQNAGQGYVNAPTIVITSPNVGSAITAKTRSIVGTSGSITEILIEDAGIGYVGIPTITISNPPLIIGIGTYQFNEVVTGTVSGTTSRVKSWSEPNKILQVGIVDGTFSPGENIVGSSSSAIYTLKSVSEGDYVDKYQQNDEIEEEADLILDFTQSNPFGGY